MKLFLSSPSLLREAIGLGAGAGELPALYDQIFAPDRRSFKPAFENLSRSLRHSGLALKAMIPTYAASCRCEPWLAMDDQAVGAEETKHLPPSRRGSLLAGFERSHHDRKSPRAPCLPDKIRASCSLARLR